MPPGRAPGGWPPSAAASTSDAVPPRGAAMPRCRNPVRRGLALTALVLAATFAIAAGPGARPAQAAPAQPARGTVAAASTAAGSAARPHSDAAASSTPSPSATIGGQNTDPTGGDNSGVPAWPLVVTAVVIVVLGAAVWLSTRRTPRPPDRRSSNDPPRSR